MATGDHTLVKHLKTDPINAPLGSQDRSMIDFALKLTREPYSMKSEDIQDLRHNGFNDEQIVDIALITCTFNFMDRLADGLGVELGPLMQGLVDKNAGLG